MSTTTNREIAPRPGASMDDRLAPVLDTPLLARIIPHLAPETLHQLIQHRGLEACGELVSCATPAQLASLLDIDLWRHAQPGHDEQFDVDRFGEWLEVLVETGDSLAARTVAAIDKQLAIAGVSRYLRVFDPGTLEPSESSDDERIDRNDMMNGEKQSDVLECETAIGGYLVRARRTDAWDAILTVLAALETDHNQYVHAVMKGCRRLSNSRPEIDGLDELLTAPEQHVHDIAVERERRRSRRGYATPADARAFLQIARRRSHTPTASASTATNPIVAAYFRAAEEEDDNGAAVPSPQVRESARDGGATEVSAPEDDISESVDAVIELLREAGHQPARPRALLAAADEDPRSATLPLLRPLMKSVLHHDETASLTRSRELAFLANTLLAGCSVQSRPLTPQEASDAAACICNLGLERLEHQTTSLPDTFLVQHDLVTVFEAGWSVLYEDVSLFVADQLLSTLADLRCGDADIDRGLRTLQRQLATQRRAGTPWLARDAADVLATVDVTAWTGLLGLLDECPIFPETLTAILERRTTPVSATAFQFISTFAQIGDIRLFMRTLSDVLSR